MRFALASQKGIPLLHEIWGKGSDSANSIFDTMATAYVLNEILRKFEDRLNKMSDQEFGDYFDQLTPFPNVGPSVNEYLSQIKPSTIYVTGVETKPEGGTENSEYISKANTRLPFFIP
jgi:uncharacterized glyoxalase superfamily metalloenzyme YdcJ